MTIPNGSNLVLVDSTGWIEFFGEGPKASAFAPYLEREGSLLLPAIAIYEVYKKLLITRGANTADRFLSPALRAKVIALDADLAVAAAPTSVAGHLPMADAIIYATAQRFQAQLITSDPHFQSLPGVTLV